MPLSFLFYDLETSGLKPQADRIMQFAGRRTSLDLEPVGEPYNELIALTSDVLPDPGAIFITGITPQQTLQDGWSEAGFTKMFNEEIAVPGTIFVGFNSVRFDDEFMRAIQYRNFYDPYEWQWRDDRGKWDLMDVVRMTRALRPDGIEWPVVDGRASNKLELLTKFNGLEHSHAHDALSDVDATIAVAQLIRQKQPKLFDWLLKTRTKQAVKKLVETGDPFVYTSGKYGSDFLHTTAAVALTNHPGGQGALVYDLRFDPTEFVDLTPEELAGRWRWQKDRTEAALPVKTLQYNRCPAVAPLSVLDQAAQLRISLSTEQISQNLAELKAARGFANKIRSALDILDKERTEHYAGISKNSVDEQLYDGFIGDVDRPIMANVHALSPTELTVDNLKFDDQRLVGLLPLYKARNFLKSLSSAEVEAWDKFRADKLTSGGPASLIAKYFANIDLLQKNTGLTEDQAYLLEELRLYGQSIAPESLLG